VRNSAALSEDFQRCGDTHFARIWEITFNPGMWAVVEYRLRRWLYLRRYPRLIRWPLALFCALFQLWIKIASNIELPSSAEIGPGLYIAHTGYIVVSKRAVLGRHCTLTQGVTIGHAGGSSRSRNASPVIGDRVYIGPGAAVIGPITIGDDALIGVGAVVTRSIPDRGVGVGNPARVISMNGSFDLVSYPGMDEDAERRLSLSKARENVYD
jgi:serine O-acetyltransferase